MVHKRAIIPILLLLFSFSCALGEGKEPVVYLEFSDFGNFLHELQSNKGYREFLGSSVLEWYAHSRLGIKFPDRIKEFEDVLGFGLSVQNINTLAGKETGIWLFDIGELEMLMVTAISEPDFLRSRIAQAKERFGEGKIDTLTFYFKKDESGNKEVDFAFLDNYLVIANEPTAFEQCVKRIASGGGFLDWKTGDFLEWMEKPMDEEYDILLYLSSESIRNTYFTSYWFYGNQEEIRTRFDRGIILLKKEKEEIAEQRIFRLAGDFVFDSLALLAVPELLKAVPENADMVKIKPVFGKELATGLRGLMGGGKQMDSLIQTVERMQPLAFGHFAVVREGEILPEIAEGFAVAVKDPDKAVIKQFNDIYPENLRSHKLFSRNMPDFALDGDMLFFSAEGGFFDKRKSINYSDLSLYSFIDLSKFGSAFSEEIGLLADSERWRSYENRDFFKKNIADLVRISTSYIRSIEMKGKIEGSLYIQKSAYNLTR